VALVVAQQYNKLLMSEILAVFETWKEVLNSVFAADE
jgi:hypothetical protein